MLDGKLIVLYIPGLARTVKMATARDQIFRFPAADGLSEWV